MMSFVFNTFQYTQLVARSSPSLTAEPAKQSSEGILHDMRNHVSKPGLHMSYCEVGLLTWLTKIFGPRESRSSDPQAANTSNFEPPDTQLPP